jgi:hypothetical protein
MRQPHEGIALTDGVLMKHCTNELQGVLQNEVIETGKLWAMKTQNVRMGVKELREPCGARGTPAIPNE